MISPSNSQRDSFRVVMVCPSTRRILAERLDGTLRLPRVSIPCYARVAEQLQLQIETRWKAKALIVDILADRQRADRVVLVEARERLKNVGTSFPAFLNDLDKTELSSEELSIAVRLLADGTTGRGPFSKLGWMEEALDWVATVAAVDPSEISCHVRQYNAGADYALVRFGRRPNAYWMKAAPAPDLMEFPITLMLARSFPEFLPSIMASHADWHAWLMRDAGEPFGECRSQGISERVMLRLAALQQASATQIDTLLSGGCYDQQVSVLRAGIPAVVVYLEEVMARQTSVKALPLSVPRLREIGRVLEDACTSLDELGIPATLMHNDINAGNILIRGGNVVVNDWAEACVGNPFITFEHLRVQTAKNNGTEKWFPTATEAYKQSWRSMIDDAAIEAAFALLPLVTPLSYLYGRGDWLISQRRYDPVFQGYARSLARYIDRAASALTRPGMAICMPSSEGSLARQFQGHPMAACADGQCGH